MSGIRRIDPEKLKKIFDRGTVIPEDSEILYNVCDMVFYKHYPYKDDLKDELIQQGMAGLCGLIEDGNYDGRYSVLTYAYARVRNSMTNYLYGDKREKSRRMDVDTGMMIDEDDWEIPEELIDEVIKFIDKKLEENEVVGTLRYCVEVYFKDKLGVDYEKKRLMHPTLDFVDKYRYYVNLIEYGMLIKYMGGRAFSNKIDDLLDVLEGTGEIDFFTKMFIASLTKEQALMLLYVFSNNRFVLPSKYKLLKIDTYMSIFKRVMFGGMSKEKASKVFRKSIIIIDSVIDNFTKIFIEGKQEVDIDTELMGEETDLEDLDQEDEE